MIKNEELVQVGLSESNKEFLSQLVDDGLINEKMDAYKIAIAIAIKKKLEPKNVSQETMFAVGNLDPKGNIQNLIRLLVKNEDNISITKLMQQLAESGVDYLKQEYNANNRYLDFNELTKGD